MDSNKQIEKKWFEKARDYNIVRPGPGREQEEDAVKADAQGEEDGHHVDWLPAQAKVHGKAKSTDHGHHHCNKSSHPKQWF